MATRAQLGNFLVGQNIAGIFLLPDDNYACPSEHWVTKVFPSAFRKFKASIAQGVSLEWGVDIFDCDDFARLAASYAELLHRATKTRLEASLAFGEFWFFSETLGGGHAINIAVVAGQDQGPKLIFFEPQDCSILNLSQSEVESCYAVRF